MPGLGGGLIVGLLALFAASDEARLRDCYIKEAARREALHPVYVRGYAEEHRTDCSGFIIGVHGACAGSDIVLKGSQSRTRMRYDRCLEHGIEVSLRKPKPGDVASFDATYDANGDGKTGEKDVASHAGWVVAVGADGQPAWLATSFSSV